MTAQPIVKKKVPPKPQSKPEKKKKKGPSKPQPAWLFPPDEENPVLNPKEKSHGEVERAIKDREKAVDYMQRRVHGVPDRPAPDPLLLALIGVFLTDFGFNSTSRLFTNERQARQTLNGWEDALGKKIDKKTPKLEQIFRDWHRDWLVKEGEETSSSESGSGASSDEKSEVEIQKEQDEQKNSDEGSDSSSADSDVEMKDAQQSEKGNKTAKTKKPFSPSPSLSSSSSDSDADDEKEKPKPKTKTPPQKGSKAVAAKPTVGDMVNKLKRKAESGSAEPASDRPEDEKPSKVKKIKTGNALSTTSTSRKSSIATEAKIEKVAPVPAKSIKASKSAKVGKESVVSTPAATAKPAKAKPQEVPIADAASSDSASASSSESDSESDEMDSRKPQKGATLPALPTASSDSSVTINGDSKKPSTNATPSSDSSSATSSSSEDSDASAPPKEAAPAVLQVVEVKPHKGAKFTPLAELSKAADAELHPSNKYQSYTYADKAYKDLSVTRGKGFTKEKNKKKRGSYRGGVIDTSGGKSYKFED